MAYLHRPKVRPDAFGHWREADREVGFWFEYDTGTESLTVLVDKMHQYSDLANMFHRTHPVLFSLPSAAREANLHDRLAEAGIRHPAATIARDSLPAGSSPADAVWWSTVGIADHRRLIEMDRYDIDNTPGDDF